MDVSSSLITVFTGLIGVLCGTAVGSYFNLKSARKDILFKRKLEYFEKLAQDLEKNIRLHKKIILSLTESVKKRNINESIKELKENRKNFLVMASPLYFNTRLIGEHISRFVDTEKEIFALLEALLKAKTSPAKLTLITELNESLQKLNKSNQTILFEMNREIHNK